jgi:glutamyl-tRNA reductase
MGIQLLSINHKTAPSRVLGLFSFDKEGRMRVLNALMECKEIEEAVFLSTCNRTEIYCNSTEEQKVFSKMKSILLKEAHIGEVSGIEDYCLRFRGERAVHHLFCVAAGLDSAVLGEDQILGQVKDAYFLAEQNGCCKKEFHSLFRLVITAAKKVKTETPLSKTSVSTASLALKKAGEILGGLDGKNIMVLGASGKIGGIVLKDALDRKGTNLFVTVRNGLPHELRSRRGDFREIPYEDRYLWMDRMDVIISATSSPHYTITKQHFLEKCDSGRRKVLVDLAVPQDIEENIGELENVEYYSMEDMEELARENNHLKKSFIPAAEMILSEYQEEYEKEHLFGQNKEVLEELKNTILERSKTKTLEQVLNHLFFEMKDVGSVEEYRDFLSLAERICWNEKNT